MPFCSKVVKKTIGRLLAMVYLGSDQAMRAIAWALLLTADLRPYGLGLLAFGCLACIPTSRYGQKVAKGAWIDSCMKYVTIFLLVYLVPFVLFMNEQEGFSFCPTFCHASQTCSIYQ